MIHSATYTSSWSSSYGSRGRVQQQGSERCIGIQIGAIACLLDVLNVVPRGATVNAGGKYTFTSSACAATKGMKP